MTALIIEVRLTGDFANMLDLLAELLMVKREGPAGVGATSAVDGDILC